MNTSILIQVHKIRNFDTNGTPYCMTHNLTAIKFYGLPLNHLDTKLIDYNFMEVQYRPQCHGDSYTVDFHD